MINTIEKAPDNIISDIGPSLRVEFQKAWRAKTLWITALAFSLTILIGGLFMFILKDPERAREFIATFVYHRYSGDEDIRDDLDVPGLLGKRDSERALRIGMAARVAFDLSASASGELANYRLRLTPTKVILEVPKRRSVIADDTVSRRLASLASVMDRKAEILVG